MATTLNKQGIQSAPDQSIQRTQNMFTCRVLQIVIFVLSIIGSTQTFAHGGHDHEDIILPTLSDLGDVHFSVSCDQKEQDAINVGLALIHHMMYAQAEQHFEQWLDTAPECAMLHWGYAMTLFHPLWPDKISTDALTRGTTALNKARTIVKSQRESDYIDAAYAYFANWENTPETTRITNWAAAHKALHDKYPYDVDAVAFYALTLLVTAPKTDKQFTNNKIAGELLEKIHTSTPRHPGALHYIIHAYDNPALADLAIEAARAYDKIAPDVPHALHMPSHIFVRLGMWDDAINWNIRSAKAALKYPTKNQTSMHYVHALDYLIYAYLQSDDSNNAASVIREMQAHHPMQANFPVAYALSAIPAREALEQKQWEKASKLSVREPSYINWENFPQVEAITHFSRGIGAARNNDKVSAVEELSRLDELHKQTVASSPNYWAILVDSQRKAVSAWLKYSNGETANALELMRTAAELEDSVDKNPVTPGAVLPARELLGDMLLLEGEYALAINAYQATLTINRERRNSKNGLQQAKTKIKTEKNFAPE